ncbi:MAG: MBG domain-containing protein [Fibromonadaceae bacterium]|jgi:hypothetical protein|nr:MBG domain-containing protein [Fibromonadaceae bacterium]
MKTINNTIATLAVTLLLFASVVLAQTNWITRAEITWYTDSSSVSNFIITTPEQLAGLAKLVNDGTQTFSGKTITLGANILLNDTTGWQNWAITAPANSWTAIGTSSTNFGGTFDGAKFVIAGLYISSSNGFQGLFGYIASNGEVKNIGVVNSYIEGDGATGSLAGQNDGTITNSYATGNVSGIGGYDVGGLAGYNGGSIVNSYATGNVSGTGIVGGLVGSDFGITITNCYATGNVSGTEGIIGGLVGLYGGQIVNSYATGNVTGISSVGGLMGESWGSGGIITNSYYNSETTNAGNYSNTSGTPKTVAELKQLATYEDWDFDDVWAISGETVNDGYPYLRTPTKSDYNMASVSFANKTVTYNGEAQSIAVVGIPSGLGLGLSITYVGNGKTNAGTYTVTANFTTANVNYNTPASMTATLTIAKANPAYTAPSGLTATAGKTLADVILPSGWTWESALTTAAGAVGTQTHKAKFTPSDTDNYNVITGIDLQVTVSEPTPIRLPQIANNNISVHATANAIVLQNLPANAKVEIYGLNGKLVYSNRENPLIGAIGVQTIEVHAKGIYIVKIGRGVSNTPNVLRVAVK